MTHPLQRQVDAVRRRARRQLLCYALAWTAALVTAAVVVLGLADYVVHFVDPGIRLFASLSVLLVATVCLLRLVLPVVLWRRSDVEVAQRIERAHPQLGQQLASATAFLSQRADDPVAGSAQLRQAVIDEVTAQVASLDLADVVDRRPARRGLLALAAVGLLAAGVIIAQPTAARIALVRLAMPLGTTVWPQQNYLAIEQPVRQVALGQDFEVLVREARPDVQLPDNLWIVYRYWGADGPEPEQRVPLVASGHVAVAHREHVTRPFSYRAVGGDDDSMPWIDVEVVEPPTVESLAIHLHFPAYTGWPAKAGERHLRALVGTRVALRATLTRPARSAAVCLEQGDRIPLEVSEDGLTVSLAVVDEAVPVHSAPATTAARESASGATADRAGVAAAAPAVDDRAETHHDADTAVDRALGWVIRSSGAYWFELEDAEGLVGGREARYEVRAVPDMPPTVSIESPEGNIFVTAEGAVPMKLVAKDDLALHSVGLAYLHSERTELGYQIVPLYQGPLEVSPLAADDAVLVERGETRTIEYRWELATLELEPGMQLTVQATASDYRPQEGTSSPRRISIITADELHDRLAERQKLLLGELARVLAMQQDARARTAAVQVQLDEVGQIERQDLDQLQGAELLERQVARALGTEAEGVRALIAGLQADLENNGLDRADVQRTMQALDADLARLEAEHLPAISRELTSALKRGQDEAAIDAPPDGSHPVAESLAAAAEHQDEVLATLESWLSNLAQWDNYRRFFRDVGQLAREQQELAEQAAELGRQTLSRPWSALDAQQQADLKKLARQQQELARRLESLQQHMQQMSAQLENEEPLASATLADALDHGQQRGLSSQMRDAAKGLEQNQIGQAAQLHRQLGEDLRELLDILANRREHELARLVKKLREAEAQMQDLRQRQEGLRKRIEQAAAQGESEAGRRQLERLSREQRQLEEEAARFARRLERLQADEAAQSTARAGSSMGQASDDASGGQGQSAADRAAAARRDLDEAQRELAQRRRQAEIDLAMEQIARIQDQLVGLRERQQATLDETRRLDALADELQRLTRGQLASVGQLARQQDSLREETLGMAVDLAGAPAFQLVLQSAADDMQAAVRRLEQRETGETTQQAAARALARLDLLLASLEPDEDEPGDDAAAEQAGDQGADGATGGSGLTGGISNLAQLKLIRLLQESILERTAALARRLEGRPGLTEEEQRQYDTLSKEQGALADLLLDLSQPTEERPEDDPSSLPDLELVPLDDLQ